MDPTRLALVLILLGLAACGGGDPEPERVQIDPQRCEQGVCS